jgi:hypothetical protein
LIVSDLPPLFEEFRVYAHDTAFEDFLTGADKFTVKETEVFEIAD